MTDLSHGNKVAELSAKIKPIRFGARADEEEQDSPEDEDPAPDHEPATTEETTETA